jgi:hypothetical protein
VYYTLDGSQEVPATRMVSNDLGRPCASGCADVVAMVKLLLREVPVPTLAVKPALHVVMHCVGAS